MSTASPIDEKFDKSAEHVDDVEYQKENQSSDGEHVSPIDGPDCVMHHIDDKKQELAFDPKETKRILRKVDIRLIPVLALLYLLAFLDSEYLVEANVVSWILS